MQITWIILLFKNRAYVYLGQKHLTQYLNREGEQGGQSLSGSASIPAMLNLGRQQGPARGDWAPPTTGGAPGTQRSKCAHSSLCRTRLQHSSREMVGGVIKTLQLYWQVEADAKMITKNCYCAMYCQSQNPTIKEVPVLFSWALRDLRWFWCMTKCYLYRSMRLPHP